MRILPYETCRKDLLKQLVEGFTNAGVELPDRDKIEKLDDIDPFTVIGICNRTMEIEQRKKIIETVQRIFYVDEFLPTNYDDLAILDGLFVESASREDIDNLWELFHFALVYDVLQSKDSKTNLSKYFEICKEIDNMSEERLKMGLFWILPELI